MPVTNYYTVNGRIRGESTSGTRTNYLHDALGSVTATANESGTVINTYRYKPYGSRLSKTGAGVDPKFQWVGQHGYRTSSGVPTYVRSRHYHDSFAAWSRIDRYWPRQAAYGYASNPTTTVDPTGTYPEYFGKRYWVKTGGGLYPMGTMYWPWMKRRKCNQDIIDQVNAWCDKINRAPNGGIAEVGLGSGGFPSVGDYIDEINDCVQKSSKLMTCGTFNSKRLECMKDFCKNGKIFCDESGATGANAGECSIKDKNRGHNEAVSYGDITLNSFGDFTANQETLNWGGVFLHELMHACGIQHGGSTFGNPSEAELIKENVYYFDYCNNLFACCINEATNNSGQPQGAHGRWKCEWDFNP